MDREAMQVALEALESDPMSHAGLVSRKQAITALRKALEEKQEPVAWLKTWSDGSVSVLKTKSHAFADHELEPLYTAPPRREWVGLTDEDIHDAFNFTEMVKQLSWDREPEQWCENFAESIEAKLKEKNHG